MLKLLLKCPSTSKAWLCGNALLIHQNYCGIAKYMPLHNLLIGYLVAKIVY